MSGKKYRFPKYDDLGWTVDQELGCLIIKRIDAGRIAESAISQQLGIPEWCIHRLECGMIGNIPKEYIKKLLDYLNIPTEIVNI